MQWLFRLQHLTQALQVLKQLHCLQDRQQTDGLQRQRQQRLDCLCHLQTRRPPLQMLLPQCCLPDHCRAEQPHQWLLPCAQQLLQNCAAAAAGSC